MSQTFTAIADLFDDAPHRRRLKGDKKKNAEPAQHIIEFPGGAIEITRTTDGTYWAHIIVNRGWSDPEQRGLHQATGEVVDSRIDWSERRIEEIPHIPEHAHLTQIAVHIRPTNAESPHG